jgi:hypothetical protein
MSGLGGGGGEGGHTRQDMKGKALSLTADRIMRQACPRKRGKDDLIYGSKD